MVQLQFRIAIEDGKLIILSETLVDHLVDEKELKVSRGLEKVFLQASTKAAELSGMDLTVMQDPRSPTLRADGTTVESTVPSNKDENDRPKPLNCPHVPPYINGKVVRCRKCEAENGASS